MILYMETAVSQPNFCIYSEVLSMVESIHYALQGFPGQEKEIA